MMRLYIIADLKIVVDGDVSLACSVILIVALPMICISNTLPLPQRSPGGGGNRDWRS